MKGGVYVLLILSNAEFTRLSWGSLPLSYLQKYLCLYVNACLKIYLHCSQGRSCWNVWGFFSHMNNTTIFIYYYTIIFIFYTIIPLIAVSPDCSEICGRTRISKGLEIAVNIYAFREDTYQLSNPLEGSISYIYCEFR